SALRGTRQSIGDAAAAYIVGQNVALEPDFVLGGGDRTLERREILGAVPEQLDPIARTKAIHGISARSGAECVPSRSSPPARRGRTAAPTGTRNARRCRRP